jgi:SET domain-containing protein
MQVASYISPKAVKGRPSAIAGRGLFAVEPIGRGEIVAIKGGHVIDEETYRRHADVIGVSDIKIADGFYLAALDPAEYEGIMLFLNHSCEPNAGVQGSIVFVAIRDIAAGEEITVDYAMFDDCDDCMECSCSTPSCRGVVTGRDWQRPELQERYGSYFSWYLLEKMRDAR